MTPNMYRGRRAVSVENERLRVTILAEGGHLAEVLDKRSGVNPLWAPKWPSIEPSGYSVSNQPRIDGGVADLSRFTDAPCSSAYTAHLMDRSRDDAFFVAFSPNARLAFGYVWRRRDFPWLGIWEENRSRTAPPWNGQEVTRGMEFGASPFPETRRRMIDRGHLYSEPTYRWIPALCSLTVAYQIQAISTDVIPATLSSRP